jgi:hypothetical protein
VPGILGPSHLPTLFRDDYVTNSNDSYWLANPEQPLEGFDRIIGEERTERSLRTRLGLRQVQQRLDGTDGLEGTGFTLDRLQQVMFSNRVYGAELALEDLVELCRATPTVDVEGTTVDLAEACTVLANWDGRVDLDSRGAHLFREFVQADGLVWAVPFDENDPVNTPNTLAVDDPAVLTALGTAVLTLEEAGVPLDARLGDVQGEPRGDRVIPIHGGTGGMGAFNVVSAPLDETDAYRDVQSGASFIMAAEFTPDGPTSRAVLAYSNATDPTSPHYADQTELYSRKQWVDLDYFEADILADPELRVTVIEEDVPVPPVARVVWREGVGRDARGLPAVAQAPVGPGPLDRIVGSLGSPNDDDMYRLCLDGDEPFVARLLGGTPPGAQLFLFDGDGRPVAAAPVGSALRVAAPAAGLRFLAVSRAANDPLGRGGALFPSPLTGPSGPAPGRAGAAVIDWSDGDRATAATPEAYRIDLRGASGCTPG